MITGQFGEGPVLYKREWVGRRMIRRNERPLEDSCRDILEDEVGERWIG